MSRELLDAEDTLHVHLQKGEDLGSDQQVSYQFLCLHNHSWKQGLGKRAVPVHGVLKQS